MKFQVIDTVWFVISFDESLNEVTQTSEMDICLQFWNKENNQVEDSYWNSTFLEHTNHEHILDCVHEGLKVFWHGKNGSAVDGWTKCKPEAFEETERREKLGSPRLIDFGRCNLHCSQCLRIWCEASGWIW